MKLNKKNSYLSLLDLSKYVDFLLDYYFEEKKFPKIKKEKYFLIKDKTVELTSILYECYFLGNDFEIAKNDNLYFYVLHLSRYLDLLLDVFISRKVLPVSLNPRYYKISRLSQELCFLLGENFFDGVFDLFKQLSF